MEQTRTIQTGRVRTRRAFTLMESLVAMTILAATVLAVGSAISAANQQSLEGQKQILGAMAADDLLSELCAVPYEDVPGYDGLDQGVGQLATLEGEAYPDTYWLIGRTVTAEETMIDVGDLGVQVRGMLVTVFAYDENRTLSSIQAFIPEPAT